MKGSRITRLVGQVQSLFRRWIGAKIEKQQTATSDDDRSTLVQEILKDSTKQMAVLNYLDSKERLDKYYTDDSKIYNAYPRDIDDPELSDVNKVHEIVLEELEDDFRSRSERLEALGVNPTAVDALKLDSDQLAEIISAVRPDTAREGGLRLLPILRIHDTDFYVDLEKLEFRQVDNAKNAISFHDVHDNWTFTSVLYDPQTKNVFRGSEAERSGRPDVVLVQLPARTQLDTQYWADRVAENAREEYLKARKNREERAEDEKSDKKQLGKNHRRSL